MATYVSMTSVKERSIAGMTDATGESQGLEDLLEQIQRASGTNPVYQVNVCDDATPLVGNWTESDSGTWDAAAVTADNRIATNALGLTNTAACNNTQYVENRYIDGSAKPVPDGNGDLTMDWTDSNYVGWWMSAIAASGFDTAGELLFALVNVTGGTETVQTKHEVQAAVNAVHQRVEIDISADDRDKVVAIRFYANNATTGQGVEIDSIIRYKFGNGKGPAIGNIVILPIASGETVARGDITQLNVADTTMVSVQEEAADAVNVLGPVIVGGTGVATGKVCAAQQISGLAYLRANAATVAGEAIIWQSDHATYGHMVEGGATGVDENSFAKGYEAAGGQYDDFLCAIGTAQTFIS